MKLNKLLILGLASSLVFTACKDDEIDPGTDPGTGNGGGDTTPTAITVDGSASLTFGSVLSTHIDTIAEDSVVVENGTNLSWNFDWLVEEQTVESDVVDPASTQWASFFSNATVGVKEGTRTVFMEQSATGVVALGMSDYIAEADLDTCMLFSDPMTLLEYPMEYGDTYSDTYFSSIVVDGQGISYNGISPDSAKIVIEGSSQSEVDGWGELVLPSGTYEVLKLTRIESTTTTISVKTSFTGDAWIEIESSTEDITSVQFYDNNNVTPILELSKPTGNATFETASFMN